MAHDHPLRRVVGLSHFIGGVFRQYRLNGENLRAAELSCP